MTLLTRLALLVALVSVVSACATTPQQPMIAPDVGNVAETTPTAPLPAVSLTPDLLYQLMLADIAVQRGQYQTAADFYLYLAKNTRDRRLAELATRTAVQAGNDKTGQEAGELWLEVDPDNGLAREYLATIYLDTGQVDSAYEQLKALLEQWVERPDSGYMMVASLLSRERDKNTALGLMERLIADKRDDPSALYAYGFLAVNSGQLDVGLENVDRLLEMQPDSTRAILLRAKILQLRGDTNVLLDYLQGVLKRYPHDLNVRLNYARTLIGKQRFDEAYKQYEILVREAPDNSDILFTFAVLSFQFEHLDEAEKYLLKLNQEGIQVTETSYYLARIAMAREQYDRAITWFDVIDNGQYYFEAQLGTAVALAKKGDLAGARARLDAITTNNPADKLRVYLTEGSLLHDLTLYKDEIQVYNAALEAMPGNTDLLFSRATAAEKLDQLDLFESDMQKVLEQEPDNAQALNALGYVLADRTTRYQEALKYIGRALELRPNDYFILDSYGWVQYRLGNYDEAIKYLRHALETSPDSEIAAHLGEVLWKAGDQEAARDVWKRALDSSPQDKILLDTINRFNPQ